MLPTQHLLLLFLVIFSSRPAVASGKDEGVIIGANHTEVVATRAYKTLGGLFNNYWKSDPLATKIKFLFVCGQVGGWGKPRSNVECSCNNKESCVNCYRWFDAVTLEAVANYGIYMNSKNHSEVAEVIYDHSPYNGEWNATALCTFIDDFSWYGIAYLRVYEWLKVSMHYVSTISL